MATSRREGEKGQGGDEGPVGGSWVGGVHPRPGRLLFASERLEVALRRVSADPWYLVALPRVDPAPAQGRAPPRLEAARPSPAGSKRPRRTSATPADLGSGRPAWLLSSAAASTWRRRLLASPGQRWVLAWPSALAPPYSRVSEGQPHLGSQGARTLSCTPAVRHGNPAV